MTFIYTLYLIAVNEIALQMMPKEIPYYLGVAFLLVGDFVSLIVWMKLVQQPAREHYGGRK